MWILYVVIGILIIWFIAVYNKFVTFRNRVQEAWADIEVQLKRRYDLIPNLVNTVKGYATHESGTFEKITNARAKAMQAHSVGEHASAEKILGQAVTGLFGIAEAYPDLKANTNFLELQRELSDTENKIQSARRFYNGNVRDFATALQVFPSNIVGNMFAFKAPDYFDIDDNGPESKPVEVKF